MEFSRKIFRQQENCQHEKKNIRFEIFIKKITESNIICI